MDAQYLVLNKEVVRKVLTEKEVEVFNSFVEKIRAVEGQKVYVINELKE